MLWRARLPALPLRCKKLDAIKALKRCSSDRVGSGGRTADRSHIDEVRPRSIEIVFELDAISPARFGAPPNDQVARRVDECLGDANLCRRIRDDVASARSGRWHIVSVRGPIRPATLAYVIRLRAKG